MLPPITKKYCDLSTPTNFQFSFFCDRCGACWESEQYPFSMRDSTPSTDEGRYVHDMIWKSEHDAAYERANTEATFHFNKCPICDKRVCDDCFTLTDDVCADCTENDIIEKGA